MTCTSGTFVAGAGDVWYKLSAARENVCGYRDTLFHYVYYHTRFAAIRMGKQINGQDANSEAEAVHAVYKSTLEITYRIRNNGDFPLEDISVTDSAGVAVSCPKTTLAPSELMVCTASMTALDGPRVTSAVVHGRTAAGKEVADEDPAFYIGETSPAIDLETYIVSGPKSYDADDPGVPIVFAAGSEFTIRYDVTNSGDVELKMVGVADNSVSMPLCTTPALAPGETITCTVATHALPGAHARTIHAFGTPAVGPPAAVTDYDPVHYLGSVD
jgi:hypothetical protein